MTGPFATRIFRSIFILAGCYNLAFGVWAGFWPEQFFGLFNIQAPLYPQIWACLGMMVGLYGLLYWYAAWKPERARPIITIGLLGKILGPIGMVVSLSNAWPRRLGMLNLYNDVIWWLPFGLFLVSGTALAKKLEKLTPYVCAAIHALGLLTMAVLLRPGMVTQPSAYFRARYISEHTAQWTGGWCVWMCCALSLVALYAWWGSRLNARRIAMLAVGLAAAGAVFDLSGEFTAVLLLVERAAGAIGHPTYWDRPSFEFSQRLVTLLTAGFANLLYTLGGILLMWQSKGLPASVRLMMWCTWIAGLAMTVAAAVNSTDGMVMATIVLFPLLILWTFWMGRNWRMA